MPKEAMPSLKPADSPGPRRSILPVPPQEKQVSIASDWPLPAAESPDAFACGAEVTPLVVKFVAVGAGATADEGRRPWRLASAV